MKALHLYRGEHHAVDRGILNTKSSVRKDIEMTIFSFSSLTCLHRIKISRKGQLILRKFKVNLNIAKCESWYTNSISTIYTIM